MFLDDIQRQKELNQKKKKDLVEIEQKEDENMIKKRLHDQAEFLNNLFKKKEKVKKHFNVLVDQK